MFGYELGDHPSDLRGHLPSAEFKLGHGALVESESYRKLPLRKPKPSPQSTEPAPGRVRHRLRIVAEEADDRAMVAGQRPGPTPLPVCQGFRPDPEPLGQGSLPESEVEPHPPDVIPKSPDFARVSPWDLTGSGCPEVDREIGNAAVRLWLARASEAWVQVHADRSRAIRGTCFRARPRPSRPPDRGSGAHVGRAARLLNRRIDRFRTRTGPRRAPATA